MAKRRTLADKLAQLDVLRADPTSEPALKALRGALAGKNNQLVAKAAQIAGQFELDALELDLVHAFERFVADPLRTDKGCVAKAAVAEALYRTGARQEAVITDVFLRGIRHVQLEPGYGGREDTAAKLRGVCAMGLVQARYAEVMVELAHLLADRVLDARIAAVRAIAYARQEAGEPLLRFKVLVGDDDHRVLYECFGALLKLAPESSLPFVAEFLWDERAPVAESAALALGESRLVEAFEFLREAWEKTLDPVLRRAELLSIAMLRHEQAIEFLLSLVADGAPSGGRDALAALEMYRHDEELWQRVRRLVDERGDVEL